MIILGIDLKLRLRLYFRQAGVHQAAWGVSKVAACEAEVRSCILPQVQFVVDKQTLEAFGFGMVPEAAIKLAGAPECQSSEVTFTVLATKSWVTAGQMELTLPLQIKGGPAVLLTLRALLVVPEVVPSSSTLDFGTVSAGHCKVRGAAQGYCDVVLVVG